MRDDRSQNNIGKLVVFVALVLVTAIAIGVLINTIGFLADQATNGTTDEAEQELQIIGQSMSVNDPETLGTTGDPIVYELRIEIQRPPETADINLTELQVDFVGENPSVLNHVSETDGTLKSDGTSSGTEDAEDVFFVEPLSVETADGVLSKGDRYEIVIPVGVYINREGTLYASPTAEEYVATPENSSYDDVDAVANLPSVLDEREGIDNTGLGVLKPGADVVLQITGESGIEKEIEVEIPAGPEAGTTVGL